MRHTSLSGDLLQTVVTHPLTDIFCEARSVEGILIVTGITFGIKRTSGKAGGRVTRTRQLDAAAGVLRSLLDGTGNAMDLALDLSWCTPFQKKVLTVARTIPRGTTVSYARLARMAGYPKAVRAVASVMRNNRYPLVIPCHRVIRSNGTVGGFMGTSSGEAVALKLRLLDHERRAADYRPAMPKTITERR
jgi:O-6-methylguanine DNA methyltransferase